MFSKREARKTHAILPDGRVRPCVRYEVEERDGLRIFYLVRPLDGKQPRPPQADALTEPRLKFRKNAA